ncbi:MAG: carboxypeptidase-like regulatory domain-containing protein, partial [Prevotella sp.]|nr:carboxypeptidase-like regulatory domain-containing protein [Prevotella sp.]
MEKRLTMLLVGLFLSLGMAFAQNKISGTVFDQDMGEPLMGATVKVQGSTKGVTTDMNGKFTIDVPAGKKLVISFVGMNTQTVTPKQGMKVNLTSNTAQVGEVVVTGIQKMDKRLFTGA